ncbi:MAG: cytochrome c [Burkholderiaceae bacterium]|nr:cytochrome c [Burkholderiaceae bacterium]
MKRSLLALACGLCITLPAAAQFQKPEQAIKYRQGTMTVMGTHFGRIAAMAAGRVPFDAKAVADNADIVATLSRLPWAGFGEGTDKGAPTRAKPEIWKEGAKFKEASEKLVAEVAKLESAGKGGNLDQIKAAVGAVGQSCKACHDNYQAEKYSAN